MPKKPLKLPLTPSDNLFTTQAERDDTGLERIRQIPLSQIDDFPGHPFQVRMDDEMRRMSDSVKTYGVLTPAVLRSKENGRYELVSGHRRKKACELAGLDMIPAVVREMGRDEAVVFMVDSNLQREKILPSEKALSYKMKMEAMKRQGMRTDLTSVPMAQKLNKTTRDIIAEEAGESPDQVRRYIRLNELIPELLEMVDNNKIAFRPAVELSYLSEKEQQGLLETIQSEDCTPSLAQAIRMKDFSKEGKLNMDVMLGIMSEEKPNQREQIKLPKERLTKYFPSGTTAQKMEDTIVKALDFYRQHQKGQQKSKENER